MSNIKKFQIGDVVRLNSGGPKMTVSYVSDTVSKEITCHYFDAQEHHHKLTVSVDMLMKVK